MTSRETNCFLTPYTTVNCLSPFAVSRNDNDDVCDVHVTLTFVVLSIIVRVVSRLRPRRVWPWFPLHPIGTVTRDARTTIVLATKNKSQANR